MTTENTQGIDETQDETPETPLTSKEKHKIYFADYFKKRYDTEPEFREKAIKASLASRAKKKEHYKAVDQEWRSNNREHLNAYLREWRKNNRAKANEYNRRWAAKKRAKLAAEKEKEKEKV